MDWKDVYKLPLQYDDNGGYVWSENGTMAMLFKFDNINYKEEQTFAKNVVDKLNGNLKIKFDKEFTLHDHTNFNYGDKYVFCVRGLGILTGGAFPLSQDKAVHIQDGFAKWILDTLNN